VIQRCVAANSERDQAVNAYRFSSGLLAGLMMAGGWIAPSSAQSPAPVEGVWLTQAKSEITIFACPDGYCGFISKVVVPDHVLNGTDGAIVAALEPSAFVDAKNKDPQLRNRPILGMQILTLKPGSNSQVMDGEIYNPEDGNTYSGYMEIKGPNLLRLNGCVLFNVVCKGEDWARAPALVE
jgi:uncharacterized protein (DUF2147 family)